MTVHDLNENELEQLKFAYFYDEEHEYLSFYEVPNEVIFEHYGHISFVEEDFYSNIK